MRKKTTWKQPTPYVMRLLWAIERGKSKELHSALEEFNDFQRLPRRCRHTLPDVCNFHGMCGELLARAIPVTTSSNTEQLSEQSDSSGTTTAMPD